MAVLIEALVAASLVVSGVLFVESFYRPVLARPARLVWTLAFLLLAAALGADALRLHGFPAVTPHLFLDLLVFVASGAFLLAVRHPGWESLGGFLVPVLAALFIAGLVFPSAVPGAVPPALSGTWLALHVVLAVTAYAAFLLAAAAGLMYLEKERELRKKEPRVFYYRLPALQESDRCSRRLVEAGMVLLTLAMAGGVYWARRVTGVYWAWTAKETWSLITWGVYALYLAARWRGLGGHRAAWLSLAAFLFVAGNFFGVNLAVHGWHNYVGSP